MSTLTRRQERPEANEARLAQEKLAREEVVRKHFLATNRHKYNEPIAMIRVANVYGDRYRVNVLATRTNGEFQAVRTYTMIDSQFIKMAVELPDR
jgi:hypothetical protein